MNTFKIGKKTIGDGNPCFIIAEAGSNHNGDIKMAKKLVDIAVESGVDAVKFQTFTADKLFSKDHPANEIVKKYEFKLEWHEEIKEYCDLKGILFMTTPFEKKAVDVLEELGTEAYKIASGDMDYHPLLEYVSSTGKPVIISSGIAYMDEVKESLKVLKSKKTTDIAVLHCIANYPPKDEEINLKAIQTLKSELDIPVGFSDHSSGITMPLVAVAMGADIIEKHFTVSRELEGMDHFYALEPDELKSMVQEIRRIELAFGNGEKVPAEGEYAERHFARRGIVAAKNLKSGHIITKDDLDYVRPAIGVESKYYKQLIGRQLNKDIEENKSIRWEDIA